MSKRSDKKTMAQQALEQDSVAPQGKGLWGQLTGDLAQRDITKPLAGLTREININYLKPDPNQPRKTMDPDRLQELADSIAQHGFIQPITVTKDPDDETYTIIAGQRRYEASKLAGLDNIPAWIRPETLDERQRLERQLVENLQREDLMVLEEARAVQALIDTTGLSQRKAAKALGKPQTYVAELQQILRIPAAVLEKAQDLPKRALVEISRGKTEAEQQSLLKQAMSSDAPFKQVKKTRDQAREPRPERFRQTYSAEGYAGKVTVSIERAPADVTTEEVAEFLGKVVETIREQASE